MELGTVLLLFGFSYGIGVFWYDLLPAKLAEKPLRVMAYPLVGMVMAHALMPADMQGPAFGSLHAMPMLLGSLLGVVVDCLVTAFRHPAAISGPEMHAHRA